MSAKGRRFTFHGAFGHKADAVRKEREVGGFIQPRTIRGQRRFVVMKENASMLRRCPKCGRLKCKHEERIPLALNPPRRSSRRAMIPGDVTEIRYRRTGSQPGNYYHPFKKGVKMIANADGSVTLRGRQRIHGNDRERGFWERYGHGPRRRNPMASNKIFGMDPLTLGLVALGGYLLYQHVTAPSASAFWAGTSPETTDALAAQRAGERDTTLADPLAAQRAGERTATDVSLTGDQPEWFGVPV